MWRTKNFRIGQGPSQSKGAYEEIPWLTNSASAPKQPVLPTDLLVQQDATSCQPSAAWPAPTDGPRRPPPALAEASCEPSAWPASLSLLSSWTPRPWVVSRLAPASPPPPRAAPRAASSRLRRSISIGARLAVGDPEVAAVAVETRERGVPLAPLRYRACLAPAAHSMQTAIADPPWGQQSRRSLLRLQL
jgi:hypothetical protein